MTVPIPHGYPDYGRYLAQTDVLFLNIDAETVNPSIDHGPFPMFGYQYVALTMSPDTKAFAYFLIWTDDSAGTHTLAIDGAVMPQASSNTIPFPVLGPWLTIRATPRTSPGAHGLRAFTVPTGASLVGANADAAIFTSGGFITVNAGTTTTFDYGTVFTGEVSVWTHTLCTSGFVEIGVLDAAGALTRLALGSNTGAAMPEDTNFTMFLPPRPLRVNCVNQSAANAQFGFAITGRVTYGGR